LLIKRRVRFPAEQIDFSNDWGRLFPGASWGGQAFELFFLMT